AQHAREQLAQLKFTRKIRERVEQRLLLVRPAPLRDERPLTVNGDARLGRSGREDLEIVIGKRVGLTALHHEHAEHLVAESQRYVHLRSTVETGQVPRFARDIRRVAQLPVTQRALAQPLTGMHMPVLRHVGPPDTCLEHAIAGGIVQEKHAEEHVAERGVTQSLHHGATDLRFIGGGRDLGGQAQQRRLAMRRARRRLSLHRAPTTARTSVSSASASSARLSSTRSTPPLNRRRSSAVTVFAVMTTTGMPRPASSRRSTSRNSNPSISGISRSSSTSAGRSTAIRSSATRPFSASVTVQPALLSARCNSDRVCRSSSTTSTPPALALGT